MRETKKDYCATLSNKNVQHIVRDPFFLCHVSYYLFQNVVTLFFNVSNALDTYDGCKSGRISDFFYCCPQVKPITYIEKYIKQYLPTHFTLKLEIIGYVKYFAFQ